MSTLRSTIKIATLTFVATVTAAFLLVNLTSGEKTVEEQIHHEYNLHDDQYERALGVLLGPPIVQGNRIEALYNGDHIFPPMLEAIRQAEQSITFETYIYWSGEIGRAFADALAERSRSGVRVHVLLDWVGSSKIDERLLAEMRQAGVQVRQFHKPVWYDVVRMNNRTHRKLLVVDGRIGFTGGVGIAPAWVGDAQDSQHWRDSHFKVEGPVVGEMQSVFMDNWIKVSGEVLHGERYFPPLRPAGGSSAQMLSSSPSGGSESVRLMYLLSIEASNRTLDISSAYFVPDDLTVNALVRALKRGVRVRIITPGPIIDSQTVRAASRATWGTLLAAGAEMYEYQPTMFHCKVFTADGLLVSVGSTNFDNRSFRLNDEANLNIYDEDFAATETIQFEADLERSKRITLEAWRERPLKERALEQIAALFSLQL